jgi:RNA polymerase subunit RPABC4/transcription elongation factor Spt4
MVRVADRRAASQGKTRSCPHCRATILESAAVCPACRHHLRFESRRGEQPLPTSKVAWRVAGAFARGRDDAPAEYSVVVVIRDPRGNEIARKVVGVGGLGPGDERSLELTVEIFDGPGAP